MNELIKYFNENYSKDYGKISYPRTTIQIYQVYQIIKSSGIEDEKILALLENVKLPKPKTIEEKEMYAECIYESVNMPASRKYVDSLSPFTYNTKGVYTLNLTYAFSEELQVPMYTTDLTEPFKFDENKTYIAEIIMDDGKIIKINDDKYANPSSDSLTFSDKLGITSDGTHISYLSLGHKDFINNGDNVVLCDDENGEFVNGVERIVINEINYINKVKSNQINNLDWNKLKDIPYQLDHIITGENKCLSLEEYGKLKRSLDLDKINLEETLPNETCTATEENYVMGDSSGNAHIYVKNIESEGFRGIKLSNYNLKKYVINISFFNYTNIKVKIVQHIVWNSAGDEDFKVVYSNFDGDKITERNISYVDDNACACKKYDLYILFAVIDKDKDGYNNYMTATIYENKYFISANELVPTGGTTGQMLVKKSNTNNDVEWKNVPSTEELAPKQNPVFTNSISLGRKADTTIGKNSFAVGNNVQASGFGSHAEGLNTKATGSYAHTEGNGTTADFYAHAEGNGTTASGDNSHAEGEKTTAKSTGSHAEGYGTTASGNYAHAEGNGTTASDIAAHAEGVETKATGRHSHAEGNGTTASGWQSHAEGSSCIASGEGSHAEGNGTTASGDYQHAQGKFNIEDTANKYAHIVGNGENDSTRSNAHTLDWKGNAWFAGKLSQEGTPTEDKDLATKKYVDDSRDNLVSNIYGNNIYNFQITEDEFNSLRNLLYNDGNNKIALNSISSDTLNTIIGSHTWYNAISFNKKIILKVKSTGSGGLVVYTKGESTDGHVNYTLLSLKSNESNIVTISHTSFIEYNYNDKIINLGILNNNKVNIQKSTKNQYINATKDFELVLPNVTEYIEIHLYLTPSSTVSITFPPSIKWKDVPTIEANKVYEIIFKYINETIGWIGEYKIYN